MPNHAADPRLQALRQIMVQNYHRDAAGHLRRRTAEEDDGPGMPPSSQVITKGLQIIKVLLPDLGLVGLVCASRTRPLTNSP
ncbi:hypothetical protein ACIQRK_23270, partial [Streptomyces anulatus]